MLRILWETKGDDYGSRLHLFQVPHQAELATNWVFSLKDARTVHDIVGCDEHHVEALSQYEVGYLMIKTGLVNLHLCARARQFADYVRDQLDDDFLTVANQNSHIVYDPAYYRSI